MYTEPTKKFYYAVATSNFKVGDNITLAEMIADELRQQGITKYTKPTGACIFLVRLMNA